MTNNLLIGTYVIYKKTKKIVFLELENIELVGEDLNKYLKKNDLFDDREYIKNVKFYKTIVKKRTAVLDKKGRLSRNFTTYIRVKNNGLFPAYTIHEVIEMDKKVAREQQETIQKYNLPKNVFIKNEKNKYDAYKNSILGNNAGKEFVIGAEVFENYKHTHKERTITILKSMINTAKTYYGNEQKNNSSNELMPRFLDITKPPYIFIVNVDELDKKYKGVISYNGENLKPTKPNREEHHTQKQYDAIEQTYAKLKKIYKDYKKYYIEATENIDVVLDKIVKFQKKYIYELPTNESNFGQFILRKKITDILQYPGGNYGTYERGIYKIKDSLKDKYILVSDNQFKEISKDNILINKNSGEIVKINKTEMLFITLKKFNDMKKTKNKIINVIGTEIANTGKYTSSNNNFVLTDKIESKTNITVLITCIFSFYLSDIKYGRRKIPIFQMKTSPEYLESDVREKIIEYIKSNIAGEAILHEYTYTILSTLDEEGEETKKKRFYLDFVNKELREENEQKIININGIFNQNIQDLPKYDKNCVLKYLNKIWANNKMSKKLLNELNEKYKNGFPITKLFDICVKRRIKMIIYDINAVVILSNYPNKRTNFHSVIGISYNGHFYPIKNDYLRIVKPQYKNIEFIENGKEKFETIVNNKLPIPTDIRLMLGSYSSYEETYKNSYDILSFISDGTKYIENKEYIQCKKYLSYFGLSDKITDGTTLLKVGEIIQQAYNKDKTGKEINLNSFLPFFERFRKGGYTYLDEGCDEIPDIDEYMTIDKKKCYPYVLKNLKFLLKCDYRTAKIYKGEELKTHLRINGIIENGLYIVKPESSTILLPDENIYYGEFLKWCANNTDLKYEIIELIECKTENNIFAQMVEDIYEKIPEKDAKYILNIFIGKMEKSIGKKECIKINGVYNTDEANMRPGHKIRINENLFFDASFEDYYNLFNMKPISVMIKDMSRKLVYEKMRELTINYTDLLQIKTDSITFKCTPERLKIIDNDLQKKGISGWKIEKYNKLQSIQYFENDKNLSFFYNIDNNNVIGNAPAGSGKTYKIINKIIPSFNINKKKKSFFDNIIKTITPLKTDNNIEKKNYIVLTPSYSVAEDYIKHGYNCNVEQCYSLCGKIPDEKYIIIDEIGMLMKGGHNLLYKMFLCGKIIYAYGDWDQLLPVGSNIPLNSAQYLKLVFNKHEELTKNYRNNFSKEYYNYLKTTNNTRELINHVSKYSVKNYKEAIGDNKVIIAYRRETRNKYNNKVLNMLNKKNILFVGCPVVCVDRKNRFKKKGTFNNTLLNIIKISGDIITLSNNQEFKKDEILNNNLFEPGYARTLHATQGKTLEKYYYAPEDYYFINNRTAYTIISRLKGNIGDNKYIKDDIDENININIITPTISHEKNIPIPDITMEEINKHLLDEDEDEDDDEEHEKNEHYLKFVESYNRSISYFVLYDILLYGW